MALVKIALSSGGEVEIEMPGERADELVASFARFVSKGEIADKRTILSPAQSFYIDFSKVAIIRREF